MIFKHNGILGINARNLLYIRPYNKRKAIKLADDKLRTKQFLAARGIPVPKLYTVIKNSKDLENLDFSKLQNSFALKPNKGFGGEGIIPIIGKKDNKFITAGKKEITKAELEDHIQDILDGRFSISNVADYAFTEQFIVADNDIGGFSYGGLPDIRVVVHNLIPVMAMLRLPTRESDGKANLHLGAVGVGIDIAKGEATHIVYKNKIIEELPDKLGKIRGFKIPHWDEILHISSKVQLITNLGYMAVDICIDKNTGPVLLEINARAGLAVQIANLSRLRKRLQRIEGVKVTSPIKGVRIAKDMFGNVVEKEIEQLSGKQVIGTSEDIEIIRKNGITPVKAKIDTTTEISQIDTKLAKQLGLTENNPNYDPEKLKLKVKLSIKGKRIQTILKINKVKSEEKMILGTRDLKNFLIDSSIIAEKIDNNMLKTNITKDGKKQTQEHKIIINKQAKIQQNKKIDRDIIEIDKAIKLLYHLKPINLEEETEKFFNKRNYNPQFEYPQLKFDPLELVEKLNKIQNEIENDESEIGKLFQNKIEEISTKIELLESINETTFTENSIKLYGEPSKEEVKECKKLLEEINYKKLKEKETQHSAEYAAKEFEKAFQKYKLDKWKVKFKKNMVTNCIAGKNNRLFIKTNAKFTKSRIKALIVHEIETHILTAENGKQQEYQLFNRGFSGYLTTQEGMAMYNVEQQTGKSFSKNYSALSHVMATHYAKKHSFNQTFRKLLKLNIPEQQAFKSTLKVKRGFEDTSQTGTFTKDYIYYKGYKEIKNFIEQGGQLSELYIGKININDLETTKNIEEMKKIKILPEWME